MVAKLLLLQTQFVQIITSPPSPRFSSLWELIINKQTNKQKDSPWWQCLLPCLSMTKGRNYRSRLNLSLFSIPQLFVHADTQTIKHDSWRNVKSLDPVTLFPKPGNRGDVRVRASSWLSQQENSGPLPPNMKFIKVIKHGGVGSWCSCQVLLRTSSFHCWIPVNGSVLHIQLQPLAKAHPGKQQVVAQVLRSPISTWPDCILDSCFGST